MNEINTLNINGRIISPEHPPYIIAELSANHNGDYNKAIEIINQAKLCGADAIKIQTYTADTITLNSTNKDFQIEGGLWDGRTLYDLYEEAHMPWDWHKPLFNHALEVGITIFSSPFDETAVDLLEDLNSPAYKIASFEAIDIPLIKYVASTKKPMIISTGMADFDEIDEAVSAAREGGCKELAILHCVSGYPALAKDYNLKTLLDMKNKFNLVTGLSDHTIDNVTAISSISMGASIIEKHFTLDRNGGGPDDSFSLMPTELEQLCRDSKIAFSAIGKVDYGPKSSEMGNIKFRRSLYFTNDINKGDIITKNCIRSVRPGYGLKPNLLETVIGKKAKKNIKKNTPVLHEVLEL